jgi:thioester reductase-like protein
LRSTATTVIHNAWHLDFNLPLSAFEPHLATTRDLLDLTESSALGARFVFVSSVSAARAWADPATPVPEDDLSDPSSCLGLGYSESKYVAAQVHQIMRLSSG